MLHVAVGVVLNAVGDVLIAHRPAHKHQGGLWEFPGGKVEPGESVQQALRRELKEELAIDAGDIQPLIKINHDYGDTRVLLDVWRVTGFSGAPRGSEGQAIRWVPLCKLCNYDFPAANRSIVQALLLPDTVAVTGEFADLQDLRFRLQRAVHRGAGMVYLRLASGDTRAADACRVAQQVCRDSNVLLCVNPDISSFCDGSVGVHLQSHQLMSTASRNVYPQQRVGASCHSVAELAQAVALGLEYVFLSPVRATPCHETAETLGLEEFAALIAGLPVPVYALGGLEPDDLNQIQLAGGRGIAAIRAFWD